MNETDYYEYIKEVFVEQLKANFNPQNPIRITALQGELHQGLRQFCEHNTNISPLLLDYSQNAQRLHLDIFILIENLQTQKFHLIIIEVKKVSNLGLTDLSQLIGYCIVANVNYGLLINVDKRISREFASILIKTPSLAQIERIHNQKHLLLGLGVMTYNHQTRQIEVSEYGHFRAISQLAKDIETKL